MSFFSNILEKLGVHHHDNAAVASQSPASSSSPSTSSGGTGSTSGSATPTQAAPKDIPVVDVVAQLEKRAAANSQKLNWRTSIVDLLKLLDIDSSLTARKSWLLNSAVRRS